MANGFLAYGVFLCILWIAPGLLTGVSRASRQISGRTSAWLLDSSEQHSMGGISLLFFAAGIAYTLVGWLFVFLVEEPLPLFILLHGAIIFLCVIHAGLIVRKAKPTRRFLEFTITPCGLILGMTWGWNVGGLSGALCWAWSVGLAGFLFATTVGRYVDVVNKNPEMFRARAVISGLVGALAGGVLGSMTGLLQGGIGANLSEGGGIGACSGFLLGGLAGALFGGLASPGPRGPAEKDEQRTLYKIFPGPVLGLFVLDVASFLFSLHILGETIRIFNSLPGIVVGLFMGGGCGALAGVICGAPVSWLSRFLLFLNDRVAARSEDLFIPILIRSLHKSQICQHCLSCSFPQNSNFNAGKRFCEFCGRELEATHERGKVVASFGDFPLKAEGRVFVLTNPDPARLRYNIEFSEVYLDPETTDRRAFERFLTYLMSSPPRLGLRSIKFFYRGKLNSLGANLNNVLHNTFPQLRELPQTFAEPLPASRPNRELQHRGKFVQGCAALLPASSRSGEHPALLLLRQRERFWEQVRNGDQLRQILRGLLPFILVTCAAYGTVLAGWRSVELSLYVAIKFPILLLGTTTIVSILNWMLGLAFGSGLSFRQVTALSYGAMTVAGWILLALAPVSLFFANVASSMNGSHAEIQRTHNYLLLTHITLIAIAGVAGNQALRKGLRSLAAPGCAINKLYLSWLAAFALVGCQLSWILRPFVGSPFYPLVFMRPDCLERNFYEFVFLEVLPYLIKGG